MTPILLTNASLQSATHFFSAGQFPDAFGGLVALNEVSRAARHQQ
jgi:hypothetical protein